MADLTPFVKQVTDAVTAFTPYVLGVGGAAVGLALAMWGIPKLVSMFKRTAR